MQDIFTQIKSLKRPALLVRAARFGVDEYRREKHLPRILRCESIPKTAEAILRLLDTEREIQNTKSASANSYDVAKHIEVLIAIMGEARLLHATSKPQIAYAGSQAV
jgi:hypothetical protein